jgi:hypothetical protein
LALASVIYTYKHAVLFGKNNDFVPWFDGENLKWPYTTVHDLGARNEVVSYIFLILKIKGVLEDLPNGVSLSPLLYTHISLPNHQITSRSLCPTALAQHEGAAITKYTEVTGLVFLALGKNGVPNSLYKHHIATIFVRRQEFKSYIYTWV